MIRIAIRAWAFCFASLTVLPGCQILSPFGSWAAKDERAQTRPLENGKKDDAHQTNSIVKPYGPTQVTIEPRGPIIEPIRQEQTKVESSFPPIAEGDLEMAVETAGAKAVLPQAPGHLPKTLDPSKDKREFAPLVMALQCFLDSDHVKAMEHLNQYDQRTQEFLIGMLPIMNIFVRKGLNEMSTQEVAVLRAQLDTLLVSLRPRSELTIDKMCYCKRVHGFGAYDQLSPNHVFLSATNDRPGEWVQLYVELRNFASEPGADGEFLTKLVCSLDLQNAKGEKVWEHTYPRKETTARRRTRLNDFHSAYNFFVPNVAPGDYKLTIKVVDETVAGSHRDVSKSLNFRVTPVLNQTTQR